MSDITLNIIEREFDLQLDLNSYNPVLNSNWTLISDDYTASSGQKLLCDTSGGSFSITLPYTGGWVSIADGADFSTNNLTILRNGFTINNEASNLTVNTSGIRLLLISNNNDWKI